MKKIITAGEPNVSVSKLPPGKTADFVKVVPETVYVGNNLAGSLIPPTYFLDLRGHRTSTTQRRFTCGWAVLKDAQSNLFALSSLDLTNDITTAGPAVGGRDQAGAFSDGAFIHFYFIYNSTLKLSSTTSSLSATSPTLPTGYDCKARVGSSLKSGGVLVATNQIMNKIWHPIDMMVDTGPSLADTWQQLDMSAFVPSTAISAFGLYGCSTNPVSARGMGVSSNSSAQNYYQTTIDPSAIVYSPKGAFFDIPLDGQYLYWIASSTSAYFHIHLLGYVDNL